MAVHKNVDADTAGQELEINPLYVRPGARDPVPRYRLAAGPMLPETAAQVVADELRLDGSSRLNLATFVTTWMEPQAAKLMADVLDKNAIDKDEYPQTAELERRCVNILGDLWHADAGAPGCSTVGSSEACMLGGMALLWNWRKTKRGTGKPNLVMSSGVQICWEKFCRYWDVEPRQVPMTLDQMHLTGAAAAAACDENTIGVVVIVGSTMDGGYEPVAEVSAALDQLTGLDIGIHVDAASGGFIAPFLQPDLEWDFRVPRVRSINASGHKYGLVYPGVGWAIWRDAAALPEELVFKVNYLGGEMPTFTLNFSRPGAQIAVQYYQLLRLGFEGYRRVQQACQDVAKYLSGQIATLGPFELLSDGSQLPVFAFRLRPDVTHFSVYDVSERLRGRGWLVPAYTLPAALEDVAVLRIVVRNGFSRDLADLLLDDIRLDVALLGEAGQANVPLMAHTHRESFHH